MTEEFHTEMAYHDARDSWNDPHWVNWGPPLPIPTILTLAIRFAVQKGFTEIAFAMYVAGGDPEFMDPDDGTTPLGIATKNHDLSTVRMLLSINNIDVDCYDYEGDTPLMIACMNGDTTVAHELLMAGADVNYAYNRQFTPLMYACIEGHLDVVRELLSTDHINVNYTDYDGDSAFSVACSEGYLEIVRVLLLDGDIDVNHFNYDGTTPLSHACYHGNTEIAQFLIDNGADKDITDNDGNSPLYWAEEFGHNNIVAILCNCPVP